MAVVDPNIDRRVLRTKEAIREAFISLIEKKGFEALTVTDITMQANINRGTFYLHYRDKYDLLEQIEAEIIRYVEKLLLQANSLKLEEYQTADQPLPAMVTMFEYLKENASLMKAILGLKGGIAFQDQVRNAAERNLKLGLMVGMKPVRFLVPREYVIAYVISAHIGVIQEWLQNGCVETTREMALILSKLSFKGPFRVIGIGANTD